MKEEKSVDLVCWCGLPGQSIQPHLHPSDVAVILDEIFNPLVII